MEYKIISGVIGDNSFQSAIENHLNDYWQISGPLVASGSTLYRELIRRDFDLINKEISEEKEAEEKGVEF